MATVLWIELNTFNTGKSENLPLAVAKRIADALRTEYGAAKIVKVVTEGDRDELQSGVVRSAK